MENEMSEKKERIEDWLDRALDNGLCYGNTECRCKFLEAITTIKSLRSELTASRDREEKAAIVIGWARGVVSGDGGESSLASALRSYDESSRAEKKEGG